MAKLRHDHAPRRVGDHLAQAVVELDEGEGWGLDAAQRARYCRALARLHPEGCPAHVLRRAIICYHLDHDLVESLRDGGHGKHLEAWTTWVPQVIAVLRHAGLSWSNDGAADLEDLVQVACLELARSLPAYRYESRFSSWAFQVVVRSVRSELRGQRARKRTGPTAYLERSEALEVPLAEADHPESVAAARHLAALAEAVLAGHPDRRLATIFRLWALEDRRVNEIGARAGLSPARVRVLIGQIVEMLRQDVQIRTWLVDEGLAGA